MSQTFEEYLAKNPQFHIIPRQDVDLIKLKLGKSHRKESDWDIIKEILSNHCLIVAEPKNRDRRRKAIEHLLYENGALVAFTNFDDLQKHIRNLNAHDGTPNRLFQIGVIPFGDAADISEKYGMRLYIDIQDEVNTMCLAYIPGEQRLSAVRVAGR